LRAGERVQVLGGTTAVLRVVEAGDEPVYNLEVDADHCYCVGQQGILVHNASASQDAATGEAALKAISCCPTETLVGVSRSTLFKSPAGLGVVYILRRSSDLVVLKTGNTVTGSEPGRWGKYAWAEANCAPFDIVAWAFDMACVIAKSMTLNDAETAVRKKFCSANTISKDNDCPWDNAQVGDWYRLDRSGPVCSRNPTSRYDDGEVG